jgi:Zn-dependent peptidase ImmA (M78 family)
MKNHPMSFDKVITIKVLREICKKQNVKVVFRNFTDDYFGKCDLDGKTIYINKKSNKKDMAVTVYHELAHVYCIKNQMWPEFHSNDKISAKKVFFVENKIEWIAKRMWDQDGMRKYFGQFEFYYSKKNKKEAMNWIKENYDSN